MCKKIHTLHHSLLTLCILLASYCLLCNGCQPSAPKYPLPEPPQVLMDAYNYERSKDGVTDFIYCQLWYFNFLDDKGDKDPSNDVAGAAAFGLANPENRLFQKGITNGFGMIIRDPSEGASFNISSGRHDPSVPGNFSASKTFEPGPGYEVQNPQGYIDVISADEYHIVGHVNEGEREITWDLTYTRTLGPGWLVWKDWPMPATLGVFPAWITYYMHMPNAMVNGTFYVKDGTNEKTYTLSNAEGYHDGFFSKCVFSLFEWDWLDYKQTDPALAIQMLNPHGPLYKCKGVWDVCTPGNLRVMYKGTEYNFTRHRDTIEIKYDRTEYNPEYKVHYPTEETITAHDAEGNRLEVRWKHVAHSIVYYDVPSPYKDCASFEMIVTLKGTFYEATTATIVPFSGSSWADWSGPAFPDKKNPLPASQ